MRKSLVILLIVLTSNYADAQFIKSKSINAQIGYGLSSPYYSVADIANAGFFLQGEYVQTISSWLDLRPYAGLIITSTDGKDLNDNPTEEKAESKALLVGGKARFIAPIPWVAPFIEIGIGGSIGKFVTYTAYTNINNSRFIYHIPVSFGLELGRNKDVDLGFVYYFQPNVEQFVGAFSIGISIPLKRNEDKTIK